MKKYTDLLKDGAELEEAKDKRMKIPHFIQIGSEFIDASGYRITIKGIQIHDLHKKKAKVLISYHYESMDDKNAGYEDNYLDHFMDIITGKYKSS